jgi:hypothetical protein
LLSALVLAVATFENVEAEGVAAAERGAEFTCGEARTVLHCTFLTWVRASYFIFFLFSIHHIILFIRVILNVDIHNRHCKALLNSIKVLFNLLTFV